MKSASQNIKEFIQSEEAAQLAEYAVMMGLVTVAIVAAINTLGDRITTAISNAATAIPT